MGPVSPRPAVEEKMLSIRQLFFLITVITAALIPIASWSKDDLIPYTASASCQANLQMTSFVSPMKFRRPLTSG